MRLPEEVMLNGKKDSRTEIYTSLKGRMRRTSLPKIQKSKEDPKRTEYYTIQEKTLFQIGSD